MTELGVSPGWQHPQIKAEPQGAGGWESLLARGDSENFLGLHLERQATPSTHTQKPFRGQSSNTGPLKPRSQGGDRAGPSAC